jgi:tetraacyldisaccharide 4'-kinase
LSRGHGGRLSSEGAVVSDGKRKLSAEDAGDEPALIADALPGVPVIIGKNRVKMGQLAVEQYQPDILLMDDGMQYWQIHKDVIITLMNARHPFGEGGVLPAGTLREPASGLKRASAVVITGVDAVSQEHLSGLKHKISLIKKSMPVYTARHVPDNLYCNGEKNPVPLDHLKGREIAALSAIGSPESFEATLESLGANIAERLRYPDHHLFDEEDSLNIRNLSEKMSVVTTEKDALRLSLDQAANVLVLGVSLEIEEIEKLTNLICEKIRV